MGLTAGGLIVDGLELLRSKKVIPHQEIVNKNIRMADGSLVTEEQHRKWTISAEIDYLPDETLKELLAKLKQESVDVEFMPPDSSEMVTATFFCTQQPKPTIRAFDKKEDPPRPIWSGIIFYLEEI